MSLDEKIFELRKSNGMSQEQLHLKAINNLWKH